MNCLVLNECGGILILLEKHIAAARRESGRKRGEAARSEVVTVRGVRRERGVRRRMRRERGVRRGGSEVVSVRGE